MKFDMQKWEISAGDNEFAKNIRQIGSDIEHNHYGNRSARNSAADYLLSDQNLSKGDRQQLALLIMGEWCTPPGRPSKSHIYPSAERKIRAEQDRRAAQGQKISLEKLAEELGPQLGFSEPNDVNKLISHIHQSLRKK